MSGQLRKRTTIAIAAVATAVAGTVASVAAVRARDLTPQTTPTTVASLADCVPVSAATQRAAASIAGHTEQLTSGGHSVIVYVPGASTTLTSTAFPVVYFLHGSPGNAQSWISGGNMPAVLDSMIAAGTLPPIIAVFPDDQGVTADDSYWGDTPLGDTVETWLTGTLVPTIDARYRTLGAKYRGIAGLSAGGFGALNISIHHPGMFSFVASYSGVFTAPDRLFGSESAQNSPVLTAVTFPSTDRTPLYLGRGADDTEFGPDTTNFIATVQSLGWAPLHTETVPGPHSWQAWSVEARDSLTWLGQLWKATC
ncbi:MAG TPA: alpha/beta hydrolase-fold protein [Candidatus Dormibacteraeota bacterium]|jgi:enterochelin esterase-like enzyme|nr:alpha/beta hydrolase-fold protein [Candidatus Dormibacteraeota bacterium]